MKLMKMRDDVGKTGGLIEQTIPYGDGEFDYDDDSEEMYDETEEAEFDKELEELKKKKLSEKN